MSKAVANWPLSEFRCAVMVVYEKSLCEGRCREMRASAVDSGGYLAGLGRRRI